MQIPCLHGIKHHQPSVLLQLTWTSFTGWSQSLPHCPVSHLLWQLWLPGGRLRPQLGLNIERFNVSLDVHRHSYSPLLLVATLRFFHHIAFLANCPRLPEGFHFLSRPWHCLAGDSLRPCFQEFEGGGLRLRGLGLCLLGLFWALRKSAAFSRQGAPTSIAPFAVFRFLWLWVLWMQLICFAVSWQCAPSMGPRQMTDSMAAFQLRMTGWLLHLFQAVLVQHFGQAFPHPCQHFLAKLTGIGIRHGKAWSPSMLYVSWSRQRPFQLRKQSRDHQIDPFGRRSLRQSCFDKWHYLAKQESIEDADL